MARLIEAAKEMITEMQKMAGGQEIRYMGLTGELVSEGAHQFLDEANAELGAVIDLHDFEVDSGDEPQMHMMEVAHPVSIRRIRE